MEDSIINQDDELVWYENDRVIQQYLNRSIKNTIKIEDRQVNKSSWLKIVKKSKRKT